MNLEDWRKEVTEGRTFLGFKDWLKRHDVSLKHRLGIIEVMLNRSQNKEVKRRLEEEKQEILIKLNIT